MRKLIIHVVENKPLITREISIQLSEVYTLTITDSTIKSFDYLIHQPPDLILLGLDFDFPLDTNNFINALRNNEKMKHLPIILIGTFKQADLIQKGLQNGATDFIFFPFINNNLSHRIYTNIKIKDPVNIGSKKSNNYKLLISENSFEIQLEKMVNTLLFEKQISLSLIANRMSMSVSTLNRKCKIYFNTTPSKYILSKKLDMSVDLLKTNHGNVKYVSNYLEFSSVPYFCLCFKKRYKLSPKKYINSVLLKDVRRFLR